MKELNEKEIKFIIEELKQQCKYYQSLLDDMDKEFSFNHRLNEDENFLRQYSYFDDKLDYCKNIINKLMK